MFKTLLLAAAGCMCLHAGTIAYTDFGPSQAYDSGSGYNVFNDFQRAASLVPTTGGTLSQFTVGLALFTVSPPTQPLNFMLETDAAGLPSGTILESWSLPAASVTEDPQLFTFTSVLNPTLTSGTQYWLVGSSTDVNGFTWLLNNQDVMGLDYNNGSGWAYQPAAANFALEVQVGSISGVPEPGSATLTSLATLLIFGVSRIRKNRSVN
jgi:hypothetical protein